jgi:hypothetical protein
MGVSSVVKLFADMVKQVSSFKVDFEKVASERLMHKYMSIYADGFKSEIDAKLIDALSSEANPNYQNENGVSLVMASIWMADFEGFNNLLGHKDVDWNLKDCGGKTAADYAKLYSRHDMLDIINARGGNITKASDDIACKVV